MSSKKQHKAPLTDLPLKDYKRVFQKMKSLSRKWNELFIEHCRQAAAENPDLNIGVINADSIYNVFSGLTKQPERRLFYFRQALIFIKNQQLLMEKEVEKLRREAAEIL